MYYIYSIVHCERVCIVPHMYKFYIFIYIILSIYFRVLSLHRPRSSLSEICSPIFKRSFVAGPSIYMTNVMGHFLLNLAKSRSTERRDVLGVSAYLITGKSHIRIIKEKRLM